LHPDVAVEIGCGLGEIISRVKAERRYGFDIDAQAITTAAHLSGHRANYSPASLFETEVIRKKIQEPNIDVLIMVNWPHALHMKELRDALAGLNTNIPIRKVIIDTIRPGAMKEAHIQHSRQDLEMLGTIRQTMDGGDGMRDIHILETHFIR
jgi:hypothetical protein